MPKVKRVQVIKTEKNLRRRRANLEEKSNKGVSTNPKRAGATNPARKEISNFKTVTDTSPHLKKNRMQPRSVKIGSRNDFFTYICILHIW